MIGAIVLAAGESRRMGRQKQLLPFADGTVIEHIVWTILESGIRDVTVVTGHRAEAVAAVLEKFPVNIVTNPDYTRGMLSSLRAGLRKAPPYWTGVLLALGDQPSIGTDVIKTLIEKFEADPKGIYVPTYDGKRGHPLLFPARFREDVMTKFDDTGLRGLFRLHPERVRPVPVDSAAVLSDMDYPEDYERELRDYAERAGLAE